MVEVLRGLLGLAVVLGLAWAMSSGKARFPLRVVAWGLGLQLLLAGLVLGTGVGETALRSAAVGVHNFVSLNVPGAGTIFGDLSWSDRSVPEGTRPMVHDHAHDGPHEHAQQRIYAGETGEGDAHRHTYPGAQPGFIFAFAATGLLVIIPFAALVGVLYHLGVMQVVIWAMAKVMTATMGVSGAEAMAMSANLFVGQTEAPLAVKPYLPGMTQSELMCMMTGGFATVAGSVLVVYMGVLGPDIGPHLLTASLLSAPAAIAIAKVVMPEAGQPATAGRVELKIERTASNVLEAAANGTTDGLKLYLNVVAMLIAFTFLVQLVNACLGLIWADLSVEAILGVLLAPFAWAIGVESWHDARLVGSLIGIKLTTNEFVAFAQMQAYMPVAEQGPAFRSERSAQLAAYALCGFANFASIGIQIGGISPLAPSRKGDLSRLALRAMLGGALASAATAAVAGMFLR
ncbi:MAG: nucleoside transporter C-terminal domain-containing protein [Planctomycetota bacterium]